MKTTVTILVLFAIVPALFAGDIESSRGNSVSSRARVSLTIPAVTAYSIARTSDGTVAISLFRTEDTVVVRKSGGASEPFQRVSLRDASDAALHVGSGGWTKIADENPAPLRRASTNGEPAENDVTYEIWSF